MRDHRLFLRARVAAHQLVMVIFPEELLGVWSCASCYQSCAACYQSWTIAAFASAAHLAALCRISRTCILRLLGSAKARRPGDACRCAASRAFRTLPTGAGAIDCPPARRAAGGRTARASFPLAAFVSGERVVALS